MTKRSTRLLWLLAMLLVAAIAVSVLLNARIVEPLYIYLQKQKLEQICDQMSMNTVSLDGFIQSVEQQDGVIVARVPDSGEINDINSNLMQAYMDKGLGLKSHWLWIEDYNSTIQNGSQQRIYSQGTLNYSLLVQYLVRDGELLAVTLIIPNISSTVALVNWLSVGLFGGVTLVLLTLVIVSNRKLTAAHLLLEGKSRQMESLLQAVSHDLRTPISLIKAYAVGMRDGLDDGSFLETITVQSQSMEQMVEQLLALSRSGQAALSVEELDLAVLLGERLSAYSIKLEQGNIQLEAAVEAPVVTDTDRTAMTSIVDNLLGNAIKYTSDNSVRVSLEQQGRGWRLSVCNGVSGEVTLDPERLWEPYYVGESSRNKALCGSGLGLAIVRAACDSMGYGYGCELEDGQFTVWVSSTLPR